MLAYNNLLSSQRITIERAFGILVRRWGLLWRPISFTFDKAPNIVRVFAILHNICVNRWKLNNILIPLNSNVKEAGPILCSMRELLTVARKMTRWFNGYHWSTLIQFELWVTTFSKKNRGLYIQWRISFNNWHRISSDWY